MLSFLFWVARPTDTYLYKEISFLFIEKKKLKLSQDGNCERFSLVSNFAFPFSHVLVKAKKKLLLFGTRK